MRDVELKVADKVQEAQSNQIEDNFSKPIVEHSAQNQLHGFIESYYQSE